MAVKKIEELNIHRDVNSTEQFDVQGYLNENWDKMQDVVDNNAEELMQAQKDISTLKEDNKTNKSSIDVLEKSNETRDGKISKNTEDIEAIQGSIKTATETINKKDNEQDGKITLNKESIKEIQAENERLREDIKSIATIGEASGENIHLEDSSEARCEIKICGNHQQDTREGYNQLKNEGTTQTLNNVTITKKEDETLVVNGTATEDFTFSIKRNIELEDGEQYKLSGCPNGGDEKKYALTINQYYENQSHFGQDYGDGVNFTYNGSLPINNNIYIRLFKGITYNNLIFKPMIVKGTEQKTYEQYGASPSIDYPSKAKSVGDNINMLFTNPDDWEQGTITDGANVSSMTRIRTKNFIDIIDNEDYYVSIQNTQYCFLNIVLYKEDKTYIGQYYSLNNAINGANHLKINLPTDAKKIRVIIRNLDNVSDISPSDIEMIKPKLEKSSVATPYSSYNCGSAKIDIFNKNYLSKIPKKSITTQGITSTFDGEKFICKGTAQTNYFNLLTENVYKKIGKGIKTLSTNKLKKGRAFIHFDYVDGTSQNYYTSINTNQVRFTLNKDVESYRLNVDSITAGDTIDDNIYVQLEDGNIATEIEKAENQEFVVDVQQPMFENDTFMKQDAKWYEMHNWIKIIVDGTNVKVTDTKDTGYVIQALLRTKNCKPGIGYSNRFIYDKVLTWKTPNTLIFTTIGVYLHFDRSLLGDLTINNENINAMLKKQYDSGNEIYVLVQLLEPQLLECTETQSKVLDEIYNKAHTYKNITNISAESAEVNSIVSLKYLKDVETEHNKLQAQINEIKELLSSTETSALLVNNLEKDLRMEVE